MGAVTLAALAVSLWAAGSGPAASAVTCRARDDARRRVYVLEARPSGGWQISMQDRESGAKWIRLALPGATPVVGTGTARLVYKNANGGRQVDLDVSGERARLEVYVDYGLEVNIEPDLDPNVDRMNTNGPLAALDCTIAEGS